MAEEKIDPEKSAKAEKEVKVPEKFKKLVEEVEKMSVLDLAELVKILEKRFGVSATPQVIAAPAQTVSTAPVEEEKTAFNVFLKEVGDKKIEVIKVVRDITGKGLKESKDLVDAAASAVQLVKENVKKEEAEDLKKKIEAAGAKVELK
jgi:large subunit ribosomal protein L7/L12